MTDHRERPTFIVHLRPEPDCKDPIKSLRFFLKRVLARLEIGLCRPGGDQNQFPRRGIAFENCLGGSYYGRKARNVMTSNFETSNELTVYQDHQPRAVDSFDYDEPGASPIRGGNAKFDAGAYFVGKEKTLLAPERRFIALDKAPGWVFLKKGCPAEYLMQVPGQPKPERPDCGDEADWPIGLDGQPSAPWKWTLFLYLIDADTGETLTFSTGTSGGKIAIDELTQQIKSMRSMQAGAMPIVELQSVQMPTKFGRKPRPSFKIVSWRNRASAADEAPPQLEAPEYDNSREDEDVF